MLNLFLFYKYEKYKVLFKKLVSESHWFFTPQDCLQENLCACMGAEGTSQGHHCQIVGRAVFGSYSPSVCQLKLLPESLVVLWKETQTPGPTADSLNHKCWRLGLGTSFWQTLSDLASWDVVKHLHKPQINSWLSSQDELPHQTALELSWWALDYHFLILARAFGARLPKTGISCIKHPVLLTPQTLSHLHPSIHTYIMSSFVIHTSQVVFYIYLWLSES